MPPLSSIENLSVIEKLSYTHIEQLVEIKDETKRLFYTVECIKGMWATRELERQIAETVQPEKIIKDPYFFEFLGLKSKDVVSESFLKKTVDRKP